MLLGTPIGSKEFVEKGVRRKVEKVREVTELLPLFQDPHTEFMPSLPPKVLLFAPISRHHGPDTPPEGLRRNHKGQTGQDHARFAHVASPPGSPWQWWSGGGGKSPPPRPLSSPDSRHGEEVREEELVSVPQQLGIISFHKNLPNLP